MPRSRAFPERSLLQVPRTRFVPVKTTDDLLLLRSDVFRLADEFRVELSTDGALQPYVALDKQFFGLIDDFEARMPDGPPSLREAERLRGQRRRALRRRGGGAR